MFLRRVMNILEMKAFFSAHAETDHSKFEKIDDKRSKKPDVHAFLLLDSMFPDDPRPLISNTGHDFINFHIDLEKLADKITEEQIIELVRCGVSCYKSDDWLSKFV